VLSEDSHSSYDGLYIGLMSGTSADGVDAALVEIRNDKIALISACKTPYPESLRNSVLQLNTTPQISLAELCALESAVTDSFVDATKTLIKQASVSAENVIAIGSHGQTVFHSPKTNPATTLQLGNCSQLATAAGIDTIGDFRHADMAVGGQGAPLMPAVHQATFADLNKDITKFIVNLGGIANITRLHKSEEIIGFDTGPANTLMDAWINRHRRLSFDENGNWARTGNVNQTLLNKLLADDYFKLDSPKSTGPDYFNLQWLDTNLNKDIDEPSVQATLAELTAVSVADQIVKHSKGKIEVVLCGGGAYNKHLVSRLKHHLPDSTLKRCDEYGIDPDYFEAMGFAWFAYRYKRRLTGNIPSVTGARRAVVLGGCFFR